MQSASYLRPRLRYLEPVQDTDTSRFVLRDPTQLAVGALVVGPAEYFLLTLMDGKRSRLDIQSEYARRTGRLLLSNELDQMLDQLNEAGYLAGDGFEAYYRKLEEDYRRAPFRELRDPDSYGVSPADLPGYLDDAMDAVGPVRLDPGVRAIVAPHLDFERGMPCYAPAYAHLRGLRGRLRVVILATNHFGRSRSVVATTQDFETHWGVVPTDRDFLLSLETACGGSLRPHELDHLREHSVELQVIWLHHLFGENLSIVPVLCPDPSGPDGTAPGDPGGVDTREFALALGEAIRRDPTPTLIVVWADLCHVGRYFEDDDPEVDDNFMAVVGEMDEAGLRFIDRNDPEGYRAHMAATGNPTRVCSVGCLYTMMTALGADAKPTRLGYHQATTREIENAVSCAAYVVR